MEPPPKSEHRPIVDPIDLDRLHARDPELLAEVVREVTPRILAVIQAYTRDYDEANDLLQDCWSRILERLENYSRCDSFTAWAIAVSKNVCKMRERRESQWRRLEMGPDDLSKVPSGWADPLQTCIAGQQRRVLFTALGKLPDAERDAIVLRLLEGRGPAETAQILGVTTPTARSILVRGIARLQKMEEVRHLLFDWIQSD